MHTDSPETSVAVVADDQPLSGLRRRLIGAGLIGLAGSIAPRLAGSARAAAPDNTGPDGGAATTTTAAPERPTDEDTELLGFAQSIELAITELYEIALESGSLGEVTGAVATSVRESHRSYGQSLNALLGRKAPGTAMADLVDSFSDGFGGDEDAFLEAAYELENVAVATHTGLIGEVVGTDGAELIAAILMAEARHSLVFADLAGETDLDALIVTDADALEPGEG